MNVHQLLQLIYPIGAQPPKQFSENDKQYFRSAQSGCRHEQRRDARRHNSMNEDG